MRADLRRLSAVSLVTALALGAGAAPALADEPAPATVGVGRATTVDAQRGTFRVTTWTDAPQATVTAVSARIRQGDTVLAELPSLVRDPSDTNVFALPVESTLKLTEDGGTLPALGRYAIDVTATDSLGNTVTRTGAGTLDFTLRPLLTGFDVGVSTWADPNIHAKGTLLGVQPGSGDRVPLPRRTVSFGPGWSVGTPTGSAVTDSSGAFAADPVPAVRTTWYAAEFSENSDEVHGSTSSIDSSDVRVRTMALSVTADKTRAVNGETVTLTGRVTDPVDGTPVADEPLEAFLNGGFHKTVRSDADGRFTVRLVAAPGAPTDSGWGSAGWTVSGTSLFQTGLYANGPLAMPADTRTTLTAYRLGGDGRLTAYGQFRVPYQTMTTYTTQTVLLEQSPNGQTGWKKVASTAFTAEVRKSFGIGVATRGGWFRLRSVGTQEHAESVSRTFHVTRTSTRVLAVDATPEPIRKGGVVTVRGTVQHDQGGWKPLANQPVQLRFAAWGSKTWKTVAWGRTNAAGQTALKARTSVDGTYTLVYVGDASHFDSAGKGDFVDVR
ncbi:hypothetical protein [Streptomyces sp. NPDC093111]|uniref:hypothetical protein n=1 Tax=Streptomyces sp. NPDC093111 TaxID=3154978 RepID=UPI00343EE6E7